MKDNQIKVKRSPKRAVYDFDKIAQILDEEYSCNVGFIHNDYPVVIPTIYGRKDRELFIHGSTLSRMLIELQKGIDVCISVTINDGLVLAKSAFNHSLNYRSVVLFGKAKVVSDEDKLEALKCISDHMIPNRWEEVRAPNSKELKVTTVLSITIDKFSAKIRGGSPEDNKEDLNLTDIWSGIIPIKKIGLPSISDNYSLDIEKPKSVVDFEINSSKI